MNSQSSNISSFIPKDTVVVASADQVSSDLAGESVILSLKNGTYYGLNAVGNSIWMLIQDPTTIDKIYEAILQEYEVDSQTCEADVQALLADLLSAQLIEIHE
jgi:Coenzyme PQQ synthesis protein D (PqqD)